MARKYNEKQQMDNNNYRRKASGKRGQTKISVYNISFTSAQSDIFGMYQDIL